MQTPAKLPVAARVAICVYVALVCAAITLALVRPESSRSVRVLRSALGAAPPPALETDATIGSASASWLRRLITHKSPPEQSPAFHSHETAVNRGILIVGAGEQLASAYVNLRVLREKLSCTLPVEVVYYGTQEAPPARTLAALNSLPAVTVIDGKKVHLADNATQALASSTHMGFMTKIFALVFITSFQEVLLLDSDNLPLMNPDDLFATSQFQDNGNLFWPDWWHPYGTILAVKPELYQTLGLPVPWLRDVNVFRCTESGQVLMDRGRNKDVLEKLWWLATQPAIAKLAHGDKDLFRVAFHLANKSSEYQQVERPARCALGQLDDRLTFMGMVQLSPVDSRPAFHHRTGPSKYIPNYSQSLDKLKTARIHYMTPSLLHSQAYTVVGRWFWSSSEVSTTAWDERNCSYNHLDVSEHARRDVPELWCKTEVPHGRLALYPVSKFSHAERVLEHAHVLMSEFTTQHDTA